MRRCLCKRCIQRKQVCFVGRVAMSGASQNAVEGFAQDERFMVKRLRPIRLLADYFRHLVRFVLIEQLYILRPRHQIGE